MFKPVRFEKRIIGKYLLTIACLLLFCTYSFSQDSTYVEKFNNDISIQISTGKNFTTIGYQDKGRDEITYKPNNPVSIGLGMSWKGTMLSFGYGFDFMRDKERGKTRSIDFQYHYYGRKVVFDIFFQRYKGFYTDGDNNGIDFRDNKDKKEINLYPDIKVRQYGVFGQYVFNGKKFSTKAVFNQSEIQRKSVGSFLLGGGVYYNKIDADSSFVWIQDKRIDNFQVGVNGGYAYTWVIKKHFYVSGAMSVGVNIGAKSFDRLTKDKLQVYPTFFPKIAMSYSHNTWSVGLSVLMNKVYVTYSKDSKVSLNSGTAQITFIKRFDSLPIVSNLLRNINL